MNKTFKNAVVSAAAVMVGVMGIGNTMAYFTTSETIKNIFTVGDLNLELEEPEWNPEEEGDGQNMYPGYTVYKNPTIKNTTSDKNGAEPCYARCILRVLDEKDQEITNQDVLKLIFQTIRFDSGFSGKFDQKGSSKNLIEGNVPGYSLKDLSAYPMINPLFVHDEERSSLGTQVYNYGGNTEDGILNVGEEAALFTTIVIPTDWTQEQMQMVGDFRIEVTAESIQSHGFHSQADALKELDQKGV